MKFLHAARRSLQSFALSLLLAGCAGVAVDRDIAPAQLSDKAVIVLSVSHDDGARSAANAIFYMDGQSLGDLVVMQTQPQMVLRNDFKGRHGRLFILEVTPGHHRIVGWQVVSAGFRITPAQKPVPLEFDVDKGDVVYLGNLHAQLVLGHKTLFGGRAANDARIVVADRSDEDIPLAEAQTPALKLHMRTALLPQGPWGESETKQVFDVPLPVIPVK